MENLNMYCTIAHAVPVLLTLTGNKPGWVL